MSLTSGQQGDSSSLLDDVQKGVIGHFTQPVLPGTKATATFGFVVPKDDAGDLKALVNLGDWMSGTSPIFTGSANS